MNKGPFRDIASKQVPLNPQDNGSLPFVDIPPISYHKHIFATSFFSCK